MFSFIWILTWDITNLGDGIATETECDWSQNLDVSYH